MKIVEPVTRHVPKASQSLIGQFQKTCFGEFTEWRRPLGNSQMMLLFVQFSFSKSVLLCITFSQILVHNYNIYWKTGSDYKWTIFLTCMSLAVCWFDDLEKDLGFEGINWPCTAPYKF